MVKKQADILTGTLGQSIDKLKHENCDKRDKGKYMKRGVGWCAQSCPGVHENLPGDVGAELKAEVKSQVGGQLLQAEGLS